MNINVLPDFSLLAAPFLTVVGNLAKASMAPNSDNIIQYSAPARIEPITLVDAALTQYEDTPDVLRTLNTLFSCYYMQAIGMSINVESMTLLRNIDNLRPNRDLNSAVADFAESSLNEYYGDTKSLGDRASDSARSRGGQLISVVTESMTLPDPERDMGQSTYMVTESESGEKILMRRATKADVEEFAKVSQKQMQKELDERGKVVVKNMSSSVKMEGGLMEAPNLAVGKIFDVTMEINGKKVSLPVLVSLRVITSSSSNLVDVYSVGKSGTSAVERFHGWMSSELRFLDDIMFCSDLIEDHKRTAIRDNTGTYMLNRQRDQDNRLAAMLTGKASIGTASNIAVLHSRTIKQVEAAIGGKLIDFATREKLFKKSYIMIMVSLDPDWGQLTIYHRGIPEVTQMSVKEFGRAKSKGGTDVSDVVKMFLAGKAPTL